MEILSKLLNENTLVFSLPVFVILALYLEIVRNKRIRSGKSVPDTKFFSINLGDRIKNFIFMVNVFNFGFRNIYFNFLVFVWRSAGVVTILSLIYPLFRPYLRF